MANLVSERLAEEYGIETTWAGKSLQISGTGLSGDLKLEPKRFELDIKLGFILAMFRDKIAAGIEKEFDSLLGVKSKKRSISK